MVVSKSEERYNAESPKAMEGSATRVRGAARSSESSLAKAQYRKRLFSEVKPRPLASTGREQGGGVKPPLQRSCIRGALWNCGLSGGSGGRNAGGCWLQSGGIGGWLKGIAHQRIFRKQFAVLMNDNAGAPGLPVVQILLGQPRDERSPIWIRGYATFEDGFGFLVTSEIFECGSKVQIGCGIFRSELQRTGEIVGGFGIIFFV